LPLAATITRKQDPISCHIEMARNFYDESDSLVLDGLEAVFLSNPGLSLDRTKKSKDVEMRMAIKKLMEF